MSSFEVKSANISFELCKIILKKTQSYKILEKQAKWFNFKHNILPKFKPHPWKKSSTTID